MWGSSHLRAPRRRWESISTSISGERGVAKKACFVSLFSLTLNLIYVLETIQKSLKLKVWELQRSSQISHNLDEKFQLLWLEQNKNKLKTNIVCLFQAPDQSVATLRTKGIEYSGEDPKPEPDMTCEAGSTAWTFIENSSTVISLADDGGGYFITLWNMSLKITLLCKQQKQYYKRFFNNHSYLYYRQKWENKLENSLTILNWSHQTLPRSNCYLWI